MSEDKPNRAARRRRQSEDRRNGSAPRDASYSERLRKRQQDKVRQARCRERQSAGLLSVRFEIDDVAVPEMLVAKRYLHRDSTDNKAAIQDALSRMVRDEANAAALDSGLRSGLRHA